MVERAVGRHYVIIMMQAYSARPATACTRHYLGGRARAAVGAMVGERTKQGNGRCSRWVDSVSGSSLS